LEYLAGKFARTGWRVKPMLKVLMTSTAYRQASQCARRTASPGGADPESVDPSNRLLWRQRLRRLEAEAIRDAMLAVSGDLDPAIGGPPVLLRALPDSQVVIDEKALVRPAERCRRSVYLLSRRAYNLSILTVFDQPLVSINCPSRDASAVPLQSLTLLNSTFAEEQARHMAARVAKSAGTSGERAIRVAFRLALARLPTANEEQICSRLLDRQATAFRTVKSSAGDADYLALVQLCHTLLNTSEFLYIE
jgi:hypothetical protein